MSAKTPSKIGNSARSAGSGIPDCAISTSNPMVFSATVLPPVLGPLMMSWRSLPSNSTVSGTTATPFGFRLRSSSGCRALTQHEMPWSAPSSRSFTGNAVVVLGKARLGELQLQFGQDADRGFQVVGMFADAAGHLHQNAMDLGQLFVQQAHQFVVLLDGFQRLDEYRLPAGRRSVGDALHAPALLGLHRNDEAVAANGDEFVLHGAAVGELSQVRPQRFVNGPPLPLDVAANARQLRRGAVVERAVGQDLVAEVMQQRD